MVGRPIGSKNKPKMLSGEEVKAALQGNATTQGPVYNSNFDPFLDRPTLVHPVEHIELSATNPITVILRMKGRAFSDAAQEQEIDWPAEWRLPLAGEAIHLSKTFGGFVEYVDFLVAEKQIVVHIR
jgi:hypothetical protein